MSNKTVIPIILCGGSGSRLWPLSRESFPKQYLSISSLNKDSMLQTTIKRTLDIKNVSDPILICNENHRFIVAEQMREIGIIPRSILLEPFGKNTAPAIGLGSMIALKEEEDPILLVLSSDHEIKDSKKFIEVVEKGIDYAKEKNLVTFGVIPSSPETGYGYIKAQNPFDFSNLKGEKILNFTEKPSIKKAKEFLQDKRYTWNSGMFVFSAKTLLNELELFCPNLISICQKSIENLKFDLDFQRINKDDFEKCPDLSIDIAVMEKTKKGVVIPLNAGWSDIGSWKSVWETSKKDKNRNKIQGNVILEDSKNSYVRSENRLVVGNGLNDLIIVETKDAVLISNKEKTQKVKEIVNSLKEQHIPEGLEHCKIYRPWGNYESLVSEKRWQVKLIVVKPGEKLSLQMHHHRSEHWVVVKGTAKVELNGNEKVLTVNQGIYIPLGSKHRLSNPGKIPLNLIEVQSGSYVGEDDIIRFEDKYGRSN